MTTKVCTYCGVEKELSFFSPHKRHRLGVYSRCKECCAEISKKWAKENPDKVKEGKAKQRVKEKNKEYHRKYLKRWRNNSDLSKEINKRWIENNKERVEISNKASGALRSVVKRGEIEKLTVCEFCGKEGYTEGAHYDYSKPLEVKWLCRSCHRKWDKEEPKTKGEYDL